MINRNSGGKQAAGKDENKGISALLLIDVISDFEFEDGEKLYDNAVIAAERIAKLKLRASDAGLPVIYVNDNYGKWQEDFNAQVDRIIESSARGREIASLLRPDRDDYYILKPQRSGFYETPLDVLLASLNVRDVIVTGFSTDICVLFTAHDAYMRGYGVRVPADCCAAVETHYHDGALELIERVAKADISTSAAIRLGTVEKKKGAYLSGSKAP
jgi:nicotinamidase-related amidase